MPTEKIQSSTKGKALFPKLSNLHDLSPKMVAWLEQCYHFLHIFCIKPEPPCVCADSSHYNLSPAQADSLLKVQQPHCKSHLIWLLPLKNKKVRGGVPPGKIPRLGPSNKKWEDFKASGIKWKTTI